MAAATTPKRAVARVIANFSAPLEGVDVLAVKVADGVLVAMAVATAVVAAGAVGTGRGAVDWPLT